jgi:poly(3-hydroxyoctanoate) depolymerase
MVTDMRGFRVGSEPIERTGTLATAGERVRYRVRGDGPPLLLMHGLGAPLELWRPLEPWLTDFQLVTFDPPGAGLSTTPEGPFGMDRFAEVAEELLSQLGLGSANVLGLSFGGMIAQELAHRSPERVERLVLCSTVYRCTSNLTGAAILAGRKLGYRPSQLATPLTEKAAARAASLRNLYTFAKRRPSGRGVYVQLRAAMTWNSRSWLDQVDMPTLVIAGSDDPIIPLSQSRTIAARIPNSRLEVIPGGGHLWTLKRPHQASRLIGDFLAESPSIIAR